MLRWLVGSSLELRFAVVASAILLLVFGVRTLPNSRLDVFPEFAPPLVEIQTECPGLSTEEVEALVTVPLESGLSGIAWLTTMRSKSVPGLSSIVLYFKRGTELMRARQLVQERVAIVGPQLPNVADPPVILSPLSATSRAMKIGLSSPKLSLIELSTLARWTIRPRLMAVPGVANVAIWGAARPRASGLGRSRPTAGERRDTRPSAPGGGRRDPSGGRWLHRHRDPTPERSAPVPDSDRCRPGSGCRDHRSESPADAERRRLR